MKKLIGILLLICAVLVGCNNLDNEPDTKPKPNDPETPIVSKQPGKFSATVLSDSMSGNARNVSLGTYTIANSKSIFFILRNVGDFPITGIALTPGKLTANGETFIPITDNGVTASPAAITVLETSGNTTVESVIEVNINHGNVIGLIAQQYIQKADFIGATLRITGKTVDAEDSVLDVTLDVDIETFIKVASFDIVYSDDEGETYKKAEYGLFFGMMYYMIPNVGKNYIKILNTGNVPVRYKIGDGGIGWENFIEWITIESGNYSNSFRIGNSNSLNFVIDTIGVAFDNGGIQYLVFRPSTSIVISNYSPYDDSMIIGSE